MAGGTRQVLRSARQLVYDSVPRRTRTPPRQSPCSFYSRHTTPNDQENFPSSPEIPLQTGPWRPGQRIPLSTQQPLSSSSMENPIRQVHSMLQELQGTMERVTEKLNSLENRITDIEGKHSQFEMLHATPPSSAPSTSPMEHNRNRRSPPELQVRFMQL